MARFVSKSDPVSVPAFVARAAAFAVGDPSEPDRFEAFGGDPIAVGVAAAAAALERGLAAHGGWSESDQVAPAAAAAVAAGVPVETDAFVALVSSWRSPAEYLSGLVGDLVMCNGSLALLETRAAVASAVMAAFRSFGLVSTADCAVVRGQVAAVSAAVAADVAARVGRNF